MSAIDKEITEITKILIDNKDKLFVKRITRKDKYPVLDNKDGSVSTHSMAWSTVDDAGGQKHVVYPTVLYNANDVSLKRVSDTKAFDIAIKSGNYITFDSPEKADWFSKNYKKIWGKADAAK